MNLRSEQGPPRCLSPPPRVPPQGAGPPRCSEWGPCTSPSEGITSTQPQLRWDRRPWGADWKMCPPRREGRARYAAPHSAPRFSKLRPVYGRGSARLRGADGAPCGSDPHRTSPVCRQTPGPHAVPHPRGPSNLLEWRVWGPGDQGKHGAGGGR